LSLLPYHDLISLIYKFGRSIVEPTYDISEGIKFELTLGRGTEGLQSDELGVWAVVDKSEMRGVREKRWDLVSCVGFILILRTTSEMYADRNETQTFPRLYETSAIPITHSVFTEHSECTDILLKTPNIGLSELIKDTNAAKVLKYLMVRVYTP
jgi:hypothetical protein